MKIQIGKFSGELDEETNLSDVLECITNLLIAEGLGPYQIASCMKEEMERIQDFYKIKLYEDSGD